MRKTIFFLVLCLLMVSAVSFSCNAQEWIYDRKDLTLNLKIGTDLEIVPKAEDYVIEDLVAKLSFFPRNTEDQEVLSISTNPAAEITDENIIFTWDSPLGNKVDFEVTAEVKVHNKYRQIKSKVDFPIKTVPTEVLKYTYPQEIIDSDNAKVSRLASELAQGHDDLFVVVHELAKWVEENIEYSLSTTTSDVSQKASWVLENRQGVCDELTSLFIAMARALGIPARFISGISYTNSELFEEKWGPHGWAEIYFPGYGWVAFDVTYGEFGYIDPSHIVLKISEDSSISATHFSWKGYKVDVLPAELKTQTSIKARGSRIEPVIGVDANIIKKETGFGSYNIVEGVIENLNNYYVTSQISISKIKELEVVGNEKKEILLKPGESKKLYWIVKVDEALDNKYIYTFPLLVYSLRNESSRTSFNAQKNGAVMSLKESQNLVAVLQEEETKTYSKSIDLSCSAGKRDFYRDETADIDCNIKNQGNIILSELNICILNNCKTIDLNINQEKSVNFKINFSSYPSETIIVKAENNEITKISQLDIRILDKPSVVINDIMHPEEVGFNDMFKTEFTLKKNSTSNPVDLEIMFYHENNVKKLRLNVLNKDRKIEFNIKGSDLNIDNNNFKILVRYKDLNGREFKTEERFVIKLSEVTFMQRIIIFFKSIGRGIESLFQ